MVPEELHVVGLVQVQAGSFPRMNTLRQGTEGRFALGVANRSSQLRNPDGSLLHSVDFPHGDGDSPQDGRTLSLGLARRD